MDKCKKGANRDELNSTQSLITGFFVSVRRKEPSESNVTASINLPLMNPTVQSSGSLIRSQLSMNLPSLKKGRQNPINKISHLFYSRVFQAAFGRLSVESNISHSLCRYQLEKQPWQAQKHQCLTDRKKEVCLKLRTKRLVSWLQKNIKMQKPNAGEIQFPSVQLVASHVKRFAPF